MQSASIASTLFPKAPCCFSSHVTPPYTEEFYKMIVADWNLDNQPHFPFNLSLPYLLHRARYHNRDNPTAHIQRNFFHLKMSSVYKLFMPLIKEAKARCHYDCHRNALSHSAILSGSENCMENQI